MDASFLKVGCLWGCTNAILTHATSDGGEGKKTHPGGIFSGGLRSLARTKVSLIMMCVRCLLHNDVI